MVTIALRLATTFPEVGFFLKFLYTVQLTSHLYKVVLQHHDRKRRLYPSLQRKIDQVNIRQAEA